MRPLPSSPSQAAQFRLTPPLPLCSFFLCRVFLFFLSVFLSFFLSFSLSFSLSLSFFPTLVVTCSFSVTPFFCTYLWDIICLTGFFRVVYGFFFWSICSVRCYVIFGWPLLIIFLSGRCVGVSVFVPSVPFSFCLSSLLSRSLSLFLLSSLLASELTRGDLECLMI